MPTLQLDDDLLLNYEEWGDREAPAVVLLHGFTSDSRMWHAHIDALSEDYRVVAPDLRGHGLSSAPEDIESYSLEIYARDANALLDELEIDVCAMVGSSFGGMIALQFAVNWPERVAALVVSDASPAYEHERYDEAFRERERGIDAMASVVERFGVAELGKRQAARMSDPFLKDAIQKRYSSMSTAGFLGAAHARRTRPDLTPVLRERISMPLLLVAGEEDPVRVGTELIAEELPSAAYVMFKGAGHPVPVNAPTAWRDVVLDFLADVEDGKVKSGKRVV